MSQEEAQALLFGFVIFSLIVSVLLSSSSSSKGYSGGLLFTYGMASLFGLGPILWPIGLGVALILITAAFFAKNLSEISDSEKREMTRKSVNRAALLMTIIGGGFFILGVMV
ncbi:hypothetical protein [Thiocapsa marina]|uniref:Uncharacterized protein n=1 Tax=Thiocapsa marina 5811 TaxID=768671 RepID=F9UHW3_9GAMM|nr:hypothetical protein [Thiocapsa marina]EGV16139.1 hypothetical protein ThimaDRAFT_4516 [Thiocapsa marina 5811]